MHWRWIVDVFRVHRHVSYVAGQSSFLASRAAKFKENNELLARLKP
jgi:hypothetical protein